MKRLAVELGLQLELKSIWLITVNKKLTSIFYDLPVRLLELLLRMEFELLGRLLAFSYLGVSFGIDCPFLAMPVKIVPIQPMHEELILRASKTYGLQD